MPGSEGTKNTRVTLTDLALSGCVRSARVERLRKASHLAATPAEDVEEWAQENAESLRSTVREQPLTSLAIAAGVGAFLALLLRR